MRPNPTRDYAHPRWSWRHRSLRSGPHEVEHALRELRGNLAARKLAEMQRLEFVRHQRLRSRRRVDAHWQDEQRAVGHVAHPVDGVAPLAAKVAFEAPLSGGGHDGNEIRTARDVALNLAIVVIAHFQPVDIEPGRDAGGFEPGLYLLNRPEIFARVADEHGVIRHFPRGRQES